MRSVILNIGTSCFVQCRGCYNHFGNSIQKQTTITNNEVLYFIAHLREAGVKKITIGGGDPLSRKDISGLLQSVRDMDISVNLDTVGTPFLKEASTVFFGDLRIPQVPVQDIIPYIHIIGIPLDGSSNEIASIFRGRRPNIFNEQLEIVRLLVRNGAHVCINTVLHRRNKKDLINIYKILKDEGVFKWQVFQFMPIGIFGHRNQHEFLVGAEDFEEVRSEIMACDPAIRVEFKSAEYRKNNYLIVDDEGTAWLPTGTDEKKIVGSIKTHTKDVIKHVLHEEYHIGHSACI